MTLLGLSGLVNFLTSVALALIVWVNKPKDRTARSSAYLNLSVAFYSGFYFLWQSTLNAHWAIWWFKLLCVGFVWINQTYLQFVAALLNQTEDSTEKWILRLSGALCVLFTYFAIAGKLFTGLEPRFGLGLWPIPTRLFTVYLLVWHIQCLFGFFQLIRGRRGNERVTRFVIVACAVGYLGGASNWPMWYGFNFPPYLNNLIAVYIGMIAYSVLYHRFMDVRLVLRDTTLHLATVGILSIACIAIVMPAVAINSYLAVTLGIVGMGLLMAFAYDPIRKALQPAIDRFVFANRFGYLEELAQLPNDILEVRNLNEMLKFLVTRLKDAAKLERVRIFMYDPGHQSYVETMGQAEAGASSKEGPRQLAETDPLVQLLRSDSRLWTQEDFGQRPHQEAQKELESLQGAACFPVNKEKELLGVVVLGRKRSGERFNQQDLKILRALRVRLENFLGQAMVITQEALNMVKDSHDMKNDVNALKGRITWRAMRIAGWKLDLEKQIQELNGTGDPGKILAVVNSLKAQAMEWFGEAERSREIEDQAVQRLSHRLKNWGEYGRVISEGFRGSRSMAAIELGQAAKISAERWRPHAEKKGLELLVEAGANLLVWGERSLVEQVIENLIDNAIKATEQGKVEIFCRPDRSGILLEVKDSGCGIPPEDLATIFEKPFYQGKGRENLEQSTGVGLYLVAQYVRSLGGRVWAESQVGKGSSFFVQLPRYNQDRERAGAAA